MIRAVPKPSVINVNMHLLDSNDLVHNRYYSRQAPSRAELHIL